MTVLKRVLIMAGGTGGHVFPGLAVARFLHDKGIEVHWLGTTLGLEAKLLPQTQYPFHTITITGVRGKGIKALLSAPYKVSKAIWQAKHIIKKISPDIVIGMGGFVSGPGGLASWLERRPLVIHEQNAIAGTTNRLLAPIAKKVLLGFPNALQDRNQNKVLTIGNPIRPEIEELPSPERRIRDRTRFHLLILGGSLGAQALNEIVPLALAKLPMSERPLILHQTGEKHFENTKKTYSTMQITANVKPFLEDIASAYAWADLVICRAGALTVSELCQVGLGAIFIPFPFAIDDHQTANAQYMVKNKAAICIAQKELSIIDLTNRLQQLIRSRTTCETMAHAAYQLRYEKVTQKFFDILSEINLKKERSVELDV